jgi:hypothetical protein
MRNTRVYIYTGELELRGVYTFTTKIQSKFRLIYYYQLTLIIFEYAPFSRSIYIYVLDT